MSKVVLFVFTFLILLNMGFAKDCGADIKCDCGDIVISDYNLTSDLVCKSNALRLKNGNLNCNNFSIIGNLTGNGLSIVGSDDIEIFNCNVVNFTNGLYMKYNSIRHGNGWGSFWYTKDYVRNVRVFDNFFYNNSIGIYSEIGNDNETYFNNVFKDNFKNSVYLKSDKFLMYNNSFFKDNIFYSSVSNKNFCKEGSGNFYYNFSGAQCDCVVPFLNLKIDDSIVFCKGDYNISNLDITNYMVSLNCNDSNLFGDGGVGMRIYGKSYVNISNCNFYNYDVALYLYSYKKGTVQHYTKNNKIFSNYFYNNSKAISFNRYSRVDNIFSNYFYDNSYNIYNDNKYSNSKYYTIDARNNFWGVYDDFSIEEKFYRPTYVSYKPYVVDFVDLDLSLNRDFVSYDYFNGSLNLTLFKDKLGFVDGLSLTIFNSCGNEIVGKTKYDLEGFSGFNRSYNLYFDFEEDCDVVFNLNSGFKFNDTNLKNNYLVESFVDFDKKIFLNLGFLEGNEDVKTFFKLIFDDYIFVENESLADFRIIIDDLRSDDIKIESFNDSVFFSFANVESLIYLIEKFEFEKNLFLNYDYSFNVNESDLELLGVYDVFDSLDEKEAIYKLLFKDGYLKESLFLDIGDDFEVYKMIKFSSIYSKNHRKKLNRSYPVVLSGGLFSDIYAWQNLAENMANEGYEVYLVEMNGGENLECENCYDYSYDDMVEEVLPRIVSLVLESSDAQKVIYVGHSNGARVMLDSLSLEFMNQSLVDTFISVGAPGAFEDKSLFAKIIEKNGADAIDYFEEKNISHVSMDDISYRLGRFNGKFYYILTEVFGGEKKISLNLFKQYYHWILDSKDIQPGRDIRLNSFVLMYGYYFYFSQDNDGIVSVRDSKSIYKNVKAKNKNILEFALAHTFMTDNAKLNYLIERFIKDKNEIKKWRGLHEEHREFWKWY